MAKQDPNVSLYTYDLNLFSVCTYRLILSHIQQVNLKLLFQWKPLVVSRAMLISH